MTIKICRSGCIIRTTDNGDKDIWVTDNAELETGHWCQKPSDHKSRLPGISRVFTCAVAEMRDKLPPADLCRNGCFSITDSENRKWTWITTCVNEEEIGHENGHWCLNTEDHLPKGGKDPAEFQCQEAPKIFERMGKNQEIVKDMWGTFIAKQPNKKDRVLVIDCPHHHLAHFCEEPKRHIPSISSSSSSSSSSSASSLPILPATRSTIDQEVSSILTTLKSGKRTASTANLSPRSDSSKSSKKTHSEEEPTESESDDDLSTTSLESELQPQPLAQKTSPPIADEYLKKFYPPGCSVRYARQEWTLHNWLEDGMISIRRESEERIINPVHVGLNLKKGDLFLVLAADKDGSFYYKAKLVTHADKKATFSLLPEETNETVVFSTNVGLLKRAIPLNDNANNILDEIRLEKQVESLYSDDPTQKIIGYDLTL